MANTANTETQAQETQEQKAQPKRSMTVVEQKAFVASYDITDKVHIDLTPDIVAKYLVSGGKSVTLPDVLRFINCCKANRLNPLIPGEVFLVKYSASEPAQIVMGKAAFTKRAFNNPNFVRHENGIIVRRGDEYINKEGCCLYPGEELIGGWCRVFLMNNGREISTYREVSLSEYSKGQSTWKAMPCTMINKVAIVQALRDAFPDDYIGLYSEEELVASGAIPCAPSQMPRQEVSVIDTDASVSDAKETITQEQTQKLLQTALNAWGQTEMSEKLKAKLAEYGVETTKDLDPESYDKVMLELGEIIEANKQA